MPREIRENPGEHVEDSAGEEEPVSQEDPLLEALKALDNVDPITAAEDEAFEESQRKEKVEGAQVEEETSLRRISERAFEQGATTYMALNIRAERNRIYEKKGKVDAEDMGRTTREAFNYIQAILPEQNRQSLDSPEGRERFIEFHTKINETNFGRMGSFLEIGKTSVQLSDALSPEVYSRTMLEAKEDIRRMEEENRGASKDRTREARYKTLKAGLREHIRGFGIAALDHDDIDTAAEAFATGDLLGPDNAELVQKVAGKITELVKSDDPAIRSKLRTARETIMTWREKSITGAPEPTGGED